MVRASQFRPPARHATSGLKRAGFAKIALLLAFVLALVVALALARSCVSTRNLDLDPHTKKEIEKARHR
jgi:hypothetical protein